MNWNKETRMDDLSDTISEGKVDSEVLPLVEQINSNPNYFTTSSCAGRIVVIEMNEIGDKEDANFLGKWHKPVNSQEVKEAINKMKKDKLVFFLFQSPIIHVRCKTLENAVSLRNIAVESGFKYSTIKSLTLDSKSEMLKIVVEILSSESLSVPIGSSGVIYPSSDHLELMISVANKNIMKSRKKLERLKSNLVQIMSSSPVLGK
jgi:tRNA wybutosine-synthesizing protein 3